jgi:hypothetical protein
MCVPALLQAHMLMLCVLHLLLLLVLLSFLVQC